MQRAAWHTTIEHTMAMCVSPPSGFPGGDRLWRYVHSIPKAELHLHIEGTLEPELMFEMAARNGVSLEGSVETHRKRRENFKVRSQTIAFSLPPSLLSLHPSSPPPLSPCLIGPARLSGPLLRGLQCSANRAGLSGPHVRLPPEGVPGQRVRCRDLL